MTITTVAQQNISPREVWRYCSWVIASSATLIPVSCIMARAVTSMSSATKPWKECWTSLRHSCLDYHQTWMPSRCCWISFRYTWTQMQSWASRLIWSQLSTATALVPMSWLGSHFHDNARPDMALWHRLRPGRSANWLCRRDKKQSVSCVGSCNWCLHKSPPQRW